jgi:hypothetical protein
MPRAGFEPAIPATKRPYADPTYALDRADTEIGVSLCHCVCIGPILIKTNARQFFRLEPNNFS